MSFFCRTCRVTQSGLLLATILLLTFSRASAQDSYLVGDATDQRLQMIVHIIGEVKEPGEYRVLDGTNILELFSKAGGPTEFSNLGGVTISRIQHAVSGNGNASNGRLQAGNQVIDVKLNDYLKRDNSKSPPLLKPGDVVFVPRNGWSKWRNVATIARDISVVVSLYFLYLRVTD